MQRGWVRPSRWWGRRRANAPAPELTVRHAERDHGNIFPSLSFSWRMENVKLLFGWIEGVGGSLGEFTVWQGKVLTLWGYLCLPSLLSPQLHLLLLPAPQHICRELCLQTASGRELIDGDMQAGAASVCVCVSVHMCRGRGWGGKRHFFSPP